MAKKAKFEMKSQYTRTFSEEFKKQKVKDIQKGLITIKELSTLYKISRTSIYKWIYLYSTLEKGVKTVVQMESEELKTTFLLQKIAELERLYGQVSLERDFYKKLIEIASSEVGYDIKKKHAPQQLNGLD